MRRPALLVLVFALACTDDALAPVANSRAGTDAPRLDAAPPPAHAFGSDTYQVGVFTGQGAVSPGLHCTDDGAGTAPNPGR